MILPTLFFYESSDIYCTTNKINMSLNNRVYGSTVSRYINKNQWIHSHKYYHFMKIFTYNQPTNQTTN